MTTSAKRRFERRVLARKTDKPTTMTPADVDSWIKRSGMYGNRTKRDRRQR